MKKALIIAAIALQVFVLAYSAGEREWVVRTGTKVFLRTAPIDPRDLFRGDYVSLDYDISTIPITTIRGFTENKKGAKGLKIYTVLREGLNGLAEFNYATYGKPATGLFIRGRQGYNWRFGSAKRALAVRYGIESYYVQQGSGREIEQRHGARNAIQVPLEMEVAVGRNGIAVIRGHRWSSLGIGLEVIENAVQEGKQVRKSARMRLTLLNASQAPLAIVNLADMCSFSLEVVAWASQDHRAADRHCSGIKPSNADIILLQPGEKRPFDFDLTERRWYVTGKDVPVEIGSLNRSEMFRIVHRPPSPESCVGLQNAQLIYHGALPSRAFHGRGTID